MGNTYKGETSEIAQNGKKLVNFSKDLDKDLKEIKTTITELSQITFGDASPKLLSVYNQLNTELKKFVTVLDTLGSNVQTSAKNMDEVDKTATNNLNFEG